MPPYMKWRNERSSWRAPRGETVYSFTMLMINADEHPLMKQFHKPTDEKRMVVVLPAERYGDWLHGNNHHRPHESLGRIPPVEYRVKQFPNLYF